MRARPRPPLPRGWRRRRRGRACSTRRGSEPSRRTRPAVWPAPAGPASRSPSTRSTRRSATPSSAARPCREPAGSPWRCRAASTRAVALAEAPDEAFGITLQLWIDPHAPDTDRACCAPGSVRRARDLCHQRGLPHLSLDLRDTFRDTIVGRLHRRLRGGGDAEPVHGLQRRLPPARARRRRRPAGCRARAHRATTRASSSATACRWSPAASTRRRTRATCSPACPADVLARLDFPLGDRTKPEVRERAAGLGLAAARAKESQEVCFLGGGDYRTFLDRVRLAARPTARSRTRRATSWAAMRASAASRPASAAASASRRPSRCTCCAPSRARSAVVVAPLRRLGTRSVPLRDVVMHVERRRVDAKLRYRSPAVGRGAGRRRQRSHAGAGARPVRDRPGPDGRAVRRRRRRRLRHDRLTTR